MDPRLCQGDKSRALRPSPSRGGRTAWETGAKPYDPAPPGGGRPVWEPGAKPYDPALAVAELSSLYTTQPQGWQDCLGDRGQALRPSPPGVADLSGSRGPGPTTQPYIAVTELSRHCTHHTTISSQAPQPPIRCRTKQATANICCCHASPCHNVACLPLKTRAILYTQMLTNCAQDQNYKAFWFQTRPGHVHNLDVA